jgi:hypothetical protein
MSSREAKVFEFSNDSEDSGDEEIVDWIAEEDDCSKDNNNVAFINSNEDEYYMLMIPDDPYFLQKDKRVLFKCLLDVDDLQFSLLPLSKQVELIESTTIIRYKPGDVLYNQGMANDITWYSLSSFHIPILCFT